MAFLILKSHFSFEKWLFGFININIKTCMVYSKCSIL